MDLTSIRVQAAVQELTAEILLALTDLQPLLMKQVL